MKKLYCNGKKDFCDRYNGGKFTLCDGCEFFDGSGSEEIEVEGTESTMTCKDCIHDAVCGCRSHEDEICSYFKNASDFERSKTDE